MKWLLSILLLIPFLCCSQDVQTIEACESSSLIQDYWVDDGPNTYYWTVINGVIISGQGSNFVTIDWNGIPYGQYLLTVSIVSTGGCGNDTSYLMVDIDECSFDGIYVPNSFTPNNDGINDIFQPVGQSIVELELFIFNRWGEQIYESYVGNPWDGRFKGEMCQQDVYVWVIYYRFKGETFMHESYGHVTLFN